MSALSAPPLKRSHSNLSQSAQSMDEDDDDGKHIPHLEGQNKSLNRELKKLKRHLLEKSNDLEGLRQKSYELEKLVVVIQQCWSQINDTTKQLVGSLQESETDVKTPVGSDISLLLSTFLDAGSKYMKHNPAGTKFGDSDLNLDRWSSSKDIEEERKRVHEVVDAKTDDVMYGSPLTEADLSQHVASTRSHLERLCQEVVRLGKLNSQQAESLFRPAADLKAVSTERNVLASRVVKLTHEIVDLKAQLHSAAAERERLHRKILVISEDGVALPPLQRSASNGSSVGVGTSTPAAGDDKDKMLVDGVAASATSMVLKTAESIMTQDDTLGMVTTVGAALGSVPPTPAGPTEAEEAMRLQVEVLEKQLAECEAERLRLDTTLTERIATTPAASSSAEVADLQKALDSLRKQSQQRVDVAHKECMDLRDKIAGLEAALQIVEVSAGEQYEKLAADAESARRVLESERTALQTELSVARGELQALPQLKAQISELEALESAARTQVGKLKEKLRKLTATQEKSTETLAQSHVREAELAQALAAASSSSGGAPGDAEKLKMATEALESQIRELKAELEDTRAGMLDLTLEIEAVAEEEARAREQAAKLLTQVGDAEAMRSGLLEENLKLHGQIEELRRETQDMQRQVESAEGLKRLQDSLMTQLRMAEKQLRAELSSVSRNTSQDAQKVYDLERLVEGLQSKLHVVEAALAEEKRRVAELQARCNEASNALSSERKAKMDLQRDLKRKARGEAGDGGEKGNKNGKKEAAELALALLRCSVCQDRFKSVAISRCFHLFCKECIDENLRNRHRKCPACGDKFGQDDVRAVFFGN